MIKEYSRISIGIVSIALLFTIIIAVTPVAFAQTPTQSTVNYGVDNSVFGNPERGFYKFTETHSNNYNPLNANTVNTWRTNYVDPDTGSNPITIISRNFYLENFLDSDVSASYLAQMQDDFDAAREAGSKIKVRFTYHKTCNWPGYQGLDGEPFRVLQHIGNLKNVLNANADVILTVQLGFVGAWGEWWATDTFAIPPTTSGSCVGPSGMTEQNWADRRAVVMKLIEELDPNRTISMRNIKWKVGVFERDTPITDAEGFSGIPVARTGHFNDCFLSGPSNSGTWSSDYSTREQQKNFVSQETKYVPMGGETCGNYSPESYCSNAIAEMERMHWSYLNTDYDSDILSQWDTCIDEIKKRLGYRFELNSGTYTDSVQPGSQFNININLENVGFAAPFNPRDVELILRNHATNDQYTVKLPDDPRYWFADKSTTYSITHDICTPTSMPTGTYDIFLNLPDPYPSIADRPEYSIRLASTDSSNGATIWETSTGYNNLLKTISVTNSVNSPSCSSNLILSADGSAPPPTPPPSATVPGAPTGLTATATSSSQINLSWNAPSNNGGAAITGYKVERQIGSGSWSTLVANAGTSTSISNSGLTSDTTYTYRVSAINSVGTGSTSNTASATPTAPPPPPVDTDGDGVPDSSDLCQGQLETINGYQDTDGCPDTSPPTSSPTTPVLVSAVLNLGVYDLAWTLPPTSLGTPNGGYDIFIDGVDTNEVHRTTSLQTQITGLNTSIQHCFKIQARWTQVNATPIGNEICATPVPPPTTSNTVPGAPTGLAATATSTSQINLSWSAPSNDGGQSIIDYKVEVKVGTGPWSILLAKNAGTETSYSDSGLTAGTTYTYRVSAINSVGIGAVSAEASATTHTPPPTTSNTVPGAPTGLAATATSTSQINLSWSAPSNDGGQSIIDYKVEVKVGTGPWSILLAKNAGTETSYSDSGLTAGTTYTYRVSAINSVGIGAVSAEASATTHTPPPTTSNTVPGAPTGLAATAVSSSQVDLSWNAPSNNGGESITDYKIEVKMGTDPWSTLAANAGTSTSYSDTGLPSDATCTYRVYAINTIGTGAPSTEISATTPPSGEPPATTATITIKAIDSNGATRSMWNELSLGGTVIATGFTPKSYQVTTGVEYTVFADNWKQIIFDHWENGSTDPYRIITINQDSTITAYYKIVDLNQIENPTITVITVNSDGIEILGYYTVLWKDGKKLATAFSPETFEVNSGETYKVSVSNYKGVKFHHWEDGSTERHRTFSISSDTTFTATYTP